MCRLARPSRPPPPVINVSLIDHGAAGPAAPRRSRGGPARVRRGSEAGRRLAGCWDRLMVMVVPAVPSSVAPAPVLASVLATVGASVSLCSLVGESPRSHRQHQPIHHQQHCNGPSFEQIFLLFHTIFFFNNFLRWDDRK